MAEQEVVKEEKEEKKEEKEETRFKGDYHVLTGGSLSPKVAQEVVFDTHGHNKWSKLYWDTLAKRKKEQGEDKEYDYNKDDKWKIITDIIEQRNEEEKDILSIPIPRLPQPYAIHDAVPFWLFFEAKTDPEIRLLWRMVRDAEDYFYQKMHIGMHRATSKTIVLGSLPSSRRFNLEVHVNAFVDHWLTDTGLSRIFLATFDQVNARLAALSEESHQLEIKLREAKPAEEPNQIDVFNEAILKIKGYRAAPIYEDPKILPVTHHDIHMYGPLRRIPDEKKVRIVWKGSFGLSMETIKDAEEEREEKEMESIKNLSDMILESSIVQDNEPLGFYYNKDDTLLPFVHICLGNLASFQKRFMVKPKTKTQGKEEEANDDDELVYPDVKETTVGVPTKFYSMSGLLEYIDDLYIPKTGYQTSDKGKMTIELRNRIVSRVTKQKPGEYTVLVTILDYYQVENHFYMLFEGIDATKTQ